MQGWNEHKLDELGKVGRGKSKHRPRNDASLYGGKYPFIQTGDIKAANFYVTEYSQTYNDKGLSQSKLWRKGTLCITIAANIAETAILGIDACFPDSIIGFVANEKKCDVRFIKYHFDLLKIHLQSISQGTTQDNLSQDKLLRFNFSLPEDVKHQKTIASVLSAYDELIEINNQRIKLLEETARELYKEWFVRMRFPRNWKIKKLQPLSIKNLVDKTIGGGWGSDSLTIKEKNKVFVLRGTDFESIREGDFTTVPMRYESDTTIQSRLLIPGDIVLENSVNASTRCTGKSILITQAILDQFDAPLIPASFCKLIRPKDPQLSIFIWLNMSILYEMGLMEYFQNVATNGIGNFQMNRFLERHVIPYKEKYREDIIEKFHLFDTSIYAVQISQLRQIRDRLLPRLISGKLPIKDVVSKNLF